MKTWPGLLTGLLLAAVCASSGLVFAVSEIETGGGATTTSGSSGILLPLAGIGLTALLLMLLALYRILGRERSAISAALKQSQRLTADLGRLAERLAARNIETPAAAPGIVIDAELDQLIIETVRRLTGRNPRFQQVISDLSTTLGATPDSAIIGPDQERRNRLAEQLSQTDRRMQSLLRAIAGRWHRYCHSDHPSTSGQQTDQQTRAEQSTALLGLVSLLAETLFRLLQDLPELSASTANSYNAVVIGQEQPSKPASRDIETQLPPSNASIGASVTLTDAEAGAALIDELQATGFIDRALDNEVNNCGEQLRAGLALVADVDAHRPQLRAYVTALFALRDLLLQPDIRALPCFVPIGLDRFADKIAERTQFKTLYSSKTPTEALQGQWSDFVWLLFRATLLLDTYWPDVAPESSLRLRWCKNIIESVLALHEIYPHPVELPVNARWIVNHPWAEGIFHADPVVPMPAPRQLVQQAAKASGKKGPLYYDVVQWGFGLDRQATAYFKATYLAGFDNDST
ncbi:MAG: hypothetical protein N838_25220 [Thiohalocapsa sp. PB-PSB1]|jgi:hypothetical protein|nr:MAG: hypothetical protein N838_25220 [Thiohalocapsa sp. PB-PSB1]